MPQKLTKQELKQQEKIIEVYKENLKNKLESADWESLKNLNMEVEVWFPSSGSQFSSFFKGEFLPINEARAVVYADAAGAAWAGNGRLHNTNGISEGIYNKLVKTVSDYAKVNIDRHKDDTKLRPVDSKGSAIKDLSVGEAVFNNSELFNIAAFNRYRYDKKAREFITHIISPKLDKYFDTSGNVKPDEKGSSAGDRVYQNSYNFFQKSLEGLIVDKYIDPTQDKPIYFIESDFGAGGFKMPADENYYKLRLLGALNAVKDFRKDNPDCKDLKIVYCLTPDLSRNSFVQKLLEENDILGKVDIKPTMHKVTENVEGKKTETLHKTEIKLNLNFVEQKPAVQATVQSTPTVPATVTAAVKTAAVTAEAPAAAVQKAPASSVPAPKPTVPATVQKAAVQSTPTVTAAVTAAVQETPTVQKAAASKAPVLLTPAQKILLESEKSLKERISISFENNKPGFNVLSSEQQTLAIDKAYEKLVANKLSSLAIQTDGVLALGSKQAINLQSTSLRRS